MLITTLKNLISQEVTAIKYIDNVKISVTGQLSTYTQEYLTGTEPDYVHYEQCYSVSNPYGSINFRKESINEIRGNCIHL